MREGIGTEGQPAEKGWSGEAGHGTTDAREGVWVRSQGLADVEVEAVVVMMVTCANYVVVFTWVLLVLVGCSALKTTSCKNQNGTGESANESANEAAGAEPHS